MKLSFAATNQLRTMTTLALADADLIEALNADLEELPDPVLKSLLAFLREYEMFKTDRENVREIIANRRCAVLESEGFARKPLKDFAPNEEFRLPLHPDTVCTFLSYDAENEEYRFIWPIGATNEVWTFANGEAKFLYKPTENQE